MAEDLAARDDVYDHLLVQQLEGAVPDHVQLRAGGAALHLHSLARGDDAFDRDCCDAFQRVSFQPLEGLEAREEPGSLRQGWGAAAVRLLVHGALSMPQSAGPEPLRAARKPRRGA